MQKNNANTGGQQHTGSVMAPRYLVVLSDHVYIEAFDPSLSESNTLQDIQHSRDPTAITTSSP